MSIMPNEVFGCLVLDPGGPDEKIFDLVDRLFVGRECHGIDQTRSVILRDDQAISRNHMELRVNTHRDRASVVDTSSNGTRLNGIRIERNVEIPLDDGDRIQVGSLVLEFQTHTVLAPQTEFPVDSVTVSMSHQKVMALVAGDLINYSTVTEHADQEVLARDIDLLYSELRKLLREHSGYLVDYVGDAFFASWEPAAAPDAPSKALRFALSASKAVTSIATDMELRYADGSPLRMGWGAVIGPATMRLMPGGVMMALGDATVLAFRLSGIAGRDDFASILVTDALRCAAAGTFSFTAPTQVTVKGRVSVEEVYGLAPG